ncbi:MAG: hypothetical protein ABI866_09235 [Dokdonella sp.]
MTKSNMFLMRATHFALPIAVGLLSLPALAAGLRVTATTSALPPSAVVAGAFGFSLANEGTTSFDSVRLIADPGHAVECADRTAQNRSFAIGGLLGPGDRVTCSSQPVAGLHHSAGVSVVARSGSAPIQVRHVSFTARPAATPNQSNVVLVAGAVLQDTNADGNLDLGETVAYDYSVINLGTLAVSGLVVTDNDGTVTCPQSTLAPGANMVCLSNHAINATEAGAGQVANEIDVSGTDGAGPVGGGDFVVTYSQGGTAGIRMFKSPLLFDDADSSGYASTGDVLRYTFVVKNSNAQDLSVVNVVEPDPTRIDTPITCAVTTLRGQAFAGLGSGVLQSNDVVLCTADYTITVTDASSGSADNLAESSGQPAIGTLASGTGASAVVIPSPADVTIIKTLTAESGSQSGIAEPGESLSYTITLTNAGGADALNYGVVDQLDPNVVFTSANNGGTLVGGNVVWSGLTVPAGGSLTLGVVVTVANPIPTGVTGIANLVYQTGTTPPPCPPAGGQCVVTPTLGVVTIAKALTVESGSQAGIAEPGETLTYTITLTNTGGTAVSGFGVTDPLDANVLFVSADNGGANSAGVITWSGLTIPANGNLVLTVVVTVKDPLPIGVQQIVNLAYHTGTPPSDCTLQPTPAACVVTPVAERPRLSVTKTADTSQVAPGGNINYTITITNVGTVVATNVVISDPLPAGVSAFTWTCTASGGVTCPNASGSGAINEQVPTFPVGAQLAYAILATVSSTPVSPILNEVSVTPSTNTICAPSQTAPPCLASVSVSVFVPAADVMEVPLNSKWMLLMILLAMGGSGLVAIRRA